MFLVSWFSASVFAASLAGLDFSETVTVQQETLVLNGLGLREKYWIDIYVAGLYVPEKTSDPQTIMSPNTAKRIHSKFIYSSVPKEKMIETLEENILRNPGISENTKSKIYQCGKWMEDFSTGDEIFFDYVPGKGTTFVVKGQKKGTIEGVEFMQAIFSMYVGKSPATEALKTGLLGL